MAANSLDQVVRYKGFTVEIGVDSASGEVDTTWESVSGGELIVETVECTVQHQNTPGKAYVGEVVLRGAMTAGRDALCTWLNDTIALSPNDPLSTKFRRTLRITPNVRGVKNRDEKSHYYYECFPVRYTFPRVSVTNTTGNTIEEVAIKPTRCELK